MILRQCRPCPAHFRGLGGDSARAKYLAARGGYHDVLSFFKIVVEGGRHRGHKRVKLVGVELELGFRLEVALRTYLVLGKLVKVVARAQGGQ